MAEPALQLGGRLERVAASAQEWAISAHLCGRDRRLPAGLVGTVCTLSEPAVRPDTPGAPWCYDLPEIPGRS
ncbi:MAG: hypothetical protein ABJA86_05150 [Nocardioidaceae bacterium]